MNQNCFELDHRDNNANDAEVPFRSAAFAR